MTQQAATQDSLLNSRKAGGGYTVGLERVGVYTPVLTKGKLRIYHTATTHATNVLHLNARSTIHVFSEVSWASNYIDASFTIMQQTYPRETPNVFGLITRCGHIIPHTLIYDRIESLIH